MATAKELGLKIGDKAFLCPSGLFDMVDIVGRSAREGVPLTTGQKKRAEMLLDLVEVVGLDVPQLPPHLAPTGTEVRYLRIDPKETYHKVGDTAVVWKDYRGWIPEPWLSSPSILPDQ